MSFPIIPISDEFHLNLFNNNDLSSDQAYLRDIILAIWLTTGNRILQFYISQNQPNDDMKLLTNYITNIYAWF